MAGKNFLDQFSTNNKPESFQEEVFVPSNTPKKPLNITVIVVLAIVVLLGGFLTWFFVLRPTIEVPSFIGQEVSDVNSWLKQQGIQASGVVFKEEYSEEYDPKIIIDQSIKEGKKVKKNVKIDFTVSKGADPNVEIKVPDIISLNLREIESWIDTNKLTNTKITYEFSDEDPLDSVISYEFNNGASETNFKRSSSLTIVVSKGKQEDQPISVPNFVGKNISEVTNWGSKNKIKIKQQEGYSSTINKDMIISQSVNPGKKITSKEALTVTVSKGEAIYAPDFSTYSKENILAWGTKNNVNIEIIERYSADIVEGKVIEQSNKDKPVNDGMTVAISLGNISTDVFECKTEAELDKWINEKNKYGANLSKKRLYPDEGSDTAGPGEIIIVSTDINVGDSIEYKISKGKYVLLNKFNEKEWPVKSDGLIDNVDNNTEEFVRLYCEKKGLTCKFVYDDSNEVTVGNIIHINLDADNKSNPIRDTYVYQNYPIVITVCDNYTGP